MSDLDLLFIVYLVHLNLSDQVSFPQFCHPFGRDQVVFDIQVRSYYLILNGPNCIFSESSLVFDILLLIWFCLIYCEEIL